VVIGLIGFTASHTFINNNEDAENGDARIFVKIIKIEDGAFNEVFPQSQRA